MDQRMMQTVRAAVAKLEAGVLEARAARLSGSTSTPNAGNTAWHGESLDVAAAPSRLERPLPSGSYATRPLPPPDTMTSPRRTPSPYGKATPLPRDTGTDVKK